jgi:hypothetical protein
MAKYSKLAHTISTDAFVDWGLILAVAILVAVILVGVGASVYGETAARLDAAPVAGRSRALPLDRAALTNVIQAFQAREAERAKAERGFVPPADPSTPS